MNHDISHCSGMDILIEPEFIRNKKKPFVKGRIVCPKKDTCHRHIAWLDLMKSNESIMVSMTFPADCINENYKLYWEDKE